MGGFDTDDFSALQMNHCQQMRGEFHFKDAQFWDTIGVFLEKEANDFDILQIRFQVFSLEKLSCELWF